MLLINAHVLCKLMFAIAYFKRYLTNDLGILQGKSAPDLYVCLGNKIMAPPSLIKTPENCTLTSVPDF
jgi:hypothetical protein